MISSISKHRQILLQTQLSCHFWGVSLLYSHQTSSWHSIQPQTERAVVRAKWLRSYLSANYGFTTHTLHSIGRLLSLSVPQFLQL